MSSTPLKIDNDECFYIVLDTETSGLIPKHIALNIGSVHYFPYILQITWLKYSVKDDKLLETNNHYIEIDKKIDLTESSKIHGLNHKFLQKHGVNIKDILLKYKKDVEDDNCKLVICHNIVFDLTMVKIECIRNQISSIKYITIFDTMYASQDIAKITHPCLLNNFKLPKLHEIYHILFSDSFIAHDSLEDCKATARVYQELQSLYKKNPKRYKSCSVL